MSSRQWLPTTVLAAVVAAGAAGWACRSPGQDKPPAGDKADSADAAVRKVEAEFVRAFNAGDARGVAALWTSEGEYVGPDGEAIRGRDGIEKEYAAFFQNNPKATLEVRIESVRLLGRHVAQEDGTLKLRLSGQKESSESRYSVLYVREDEGWRMATVREWLVDPAEQVSLQDIAWLIGEWVGKGEDTEAHTTYSWDADKTFIHCRYQVKSGDKVLSSGTQIIGKDPSGGLRAWVFDSSGSSGESSWSRDGDRWVMDASGKLPDGSDLTTTNILIPLGKDAFTWQSVERTAGGTLLPDGPPLKVTRVKAGK
jgi:uncharacterized protein (TIGR02246 family)